MKSRLRTAAISVSIALVLLAGTASSAFAAPPLKVHIEVDEIVATSGEPFLASGPAVLAGLVCPSGTVDDLSGTVSGSPGGAFSILHVLKRFNCDDASGTFDVALTVKLNNSTHFTTASWRIVAGTGNYVGLHANGSLAGTPIVPAVSIHDVYDGKVH